MSIKALYVLKYHNPQKLQIPKIRVALWLQRVSVGTTRKMTFPTYHYNLTLAMVYFRIQSLGIRSRPHNQGSQSLFVGGCPGTTYYTVLLERSSADET